MEPTTTDVLLERLITEQQIANALLALQLLQSEPMPMSLLGVLNGLIDSAFGERTKQPLAPTAFGDDV